MIFILLAFIGGIVYFTQKQNGIEKLHANPHLSSHFVQMPREELEPFLQNVVITLHGNPVSQELPTYGAKLIGCRECILDLHGIPRLRTWTVLSRPGLAGASTICLKDRVDWLAGME